MSSFLQWFSSLIYSFLRSLFLSGKRQVLRAGLSALLLCTVSLSPITSYASVATPSAPDPDGSLWEDVDLINDLEGDDYEVATSSDALLRIESLVGDIRSALLPAQSGEEDSPDVVAFSDSDLEMQASSEETGNFYVNCLRFNCVVGGSNCTLLFPSSARSSLFIDRDGYLWNMTSSAVQGRVFYNNDWDPFSTEGTLVYLQPCLGNNFSVNYNYGSPNFFRRYYWSSSRLTYTDTYVRILVENQPFILYTDDIPLYALIMLGGAILICLLKKSLR